MGDRLVEHNDRRFQFDAHGEQACSSAIGKSQPRSFNANIFLSM